MKVKKGYTLLEIVIALAILAIMILPLGNSLVTSVKANKMAEIKQESKLISQEIIENLRTKGNVEAGTLKVGNNDEIVTVNKINNKEFKVTGNVNEVKVSGTISKNFSDREIVDTSDEYANKKLNLLFVVENSSSGKGDIAYYYDAITPKSIDKHLESSSKNPLVNKNRIHVLFEEKDSNVKATIANKYENGAGNDINLLSVNNPDGKPISVGVYVKDSRDGSSDKKLITLNLDSLKEGTKDPGETIEAYFFNNKFVPPNEAPSIVDGEFKDSFTKSKKIGTKVNVTDNITYIEKTERKNKGLYTIELKMEKKDVVEKTKSEFIVSK